MRGDGAGAARSCELQLFCPSDMKGSNASDVERAVLNATELLSIDGRLHMSVATYRRCQWRTPLDAGKLDLRTRV
jgi:hypothetical protein